MEIELIGQHTMVFGLKGAGKSNWVAHVLSQSQYRNHLVYDLCREHGGDSDLNRIIPNYRSGDAAKQEFDTALRHFVTENDRSVRPDLFIGEETSRYAPNQGATPDSLLDLIDLNRHYGCGFLGVARRPAQVDTTLVELADNIVIFAIRGKNDHRRLESEAEGLGDAARNLDPYQFLIVDKTRSWAVHEAVPEYNTTGKL